MAWILLILSGSLEAVWAHALTDILDPVSALTFVLGLAGSVWGLQRAMRTIPMGTAYAIWVGVGATVTAVWSGIEGEPFGPAKSSAAAGLRRTTLRTTHRRLRTHPLRRTGDPVAEAAAPHAPGSPGHTAG
jgi:quaternary ammonium compound-resistance protein SugE